MEPKAGSPMFCCCLQWGSSGIWGQLFPLLCFNIPICEMGTAQLRTQTLRRDSLVLAHSCEYRVPQMQYGGSVYHQDPFWRIPCHHSQQRLHSIIPPKGHRWRCLELGTQSPTHPNVYSPPGPHSTFWDGRSHPSTHPPTSTCSSHPPQLRLEPHLGVLYIFAGWGENNINKKQ